MAYRSTEAQTLDTHDWHHLAMTRWDVTQHGVRHRLSMTSQGFLLEGPAGRQIAWDRVSGVSYPTTFAICIETSDGEPALRLGFPGRSSVEAFRLALETLDRDAVVNQFGPGSSDGPESIGGPEEQPSSSSRNVSSAEVRRLLHQAIVLEIESHTIGGRAVTFDRETGRQWFEDNRGTAVFESLKNDLRTSVKRLERNGLTSKQLHIEAASLALGCLLNMHVSSNPETVLSGDSELNSWYRSQKASFDPAGELTNREFADVNVYFLLQEAAYMLEVPEFLENVTQVQPTYSLEKRLATLEATNKNLRTVIVATLVGALALGILAFSTAEHWTKVDVAEHPETFRTEDYKTSEFTVTNDGVSPCVVGQNWAGCIDSMNAEHADACESKGAGRLARSKFLFDLNATAHAKDVCKDYETELERMRRIDAAYVSSLGTYGRLTRTQLSATRRVSNKDQRPAVTHRATCYLGFIGECA